MSKSQKQKVSGASKQRQTPRQVGKVAQAPMARMEEPDWLALQRGLDDAAMASVAGMVALQGTAGNRAVQRLVDQAAAETVLQRSCGDAAQHLKEMKVPANCHEYVLTQKGASKQMVAEFRARSDATAPGASLANSWYGANILDGAGRVTQNTVKWLPPGTVLFTGDRSNPPHSMIVKKQTDTDTLVEGFNNTGTFGPDAPYLKMDTQLRSLHTPAPALQKAGMTTQWEGRDFKTPGGLVVMNAVPDDTFRANVRQAAATG